MERRPKPSPVQDHIASIHCEDCNMTKADIARLVGCSEKYVWVVFQRLGITTGVPAKLPEETYEAMRRAPLPRGWRETIARPLRFRQRAVRNETCLKITYHDGHAEECGAPTHGRTYCKDCNEGLVTMFDPEPQTPPHQRAA